MSKSKRHKTNYPGVYYRLTNRIGRTGDERVYYIVFKKNAKTIEEKVGRQYADNMTPSKAAGIRADRIEGKRLSRKEIRERNKQLSERPTIDRIWLEYLNERPQNNNTAIDTNRFTTHLKNRSAVCTTNLE